VARIADGPSTEQRRAQILDAAMTVFSQRGYDAATTKEIADLVGVTPPLLYSYFPSKRDLLAAVVVERGTVTADASILTSDEDGADPRDRLYRWSMDLTRRLNAAANLPAFRVMLMEGMHDEEVGSVFKAEVERMKAPVAAYVSRMIALGRFRHVDPDFVAEIMIHILTRSGPQPVKREHEAAPEQFVAAFIDLVLNGLLMPDAAATGTAST
jgi:AcrR family transcriptional regulator